MEEPEPLNGPCGVLPGTGEEDNAAAMKIIMLRLKLSQGCIEAVKKMPSPNFNQEQCGYLVNKLDVVVQVARSFLEVSCSEHCGPDSSWNVTKWVGIFKLLLTLGKQIEDFIAECSKSAWVEAAMTLADMAEYVSSLGFNLELCKGFFMEIQCAAIQRVLTSVEVDNLYKAEVEMVKLKAIVDKEYLLKKVTMAADASDVAKHLLDRLRLIPTGDEGNTCGKLFDWVNIDTSAEQLGKGTFATVYKATLFGTPVAQKTFFGPENGFFLKEVEILSQLCHPNITSMFASTMNKRRCSIIMELMDCDLLALIQRRCWEQSDCPPFSLSESLDLMLQIAEGMKYLHTKRIIHRDLKSNNILVKMVRTGELETGYLQAKVVDFGLSKIKETSASYSCMTYDQGTPRWMAPEVMRPGVDDLDCVARSAVVLNYKFKCDVYSFAMVCYEILTGELPFKHERSFEKIKQLVLMGERPELPSDCPALLKGLIEKCWIGNPRERPTFGTICSTLQYLKYLVMRSDITPEGSEGSFDPTLSEGSGYLAEVVTSKCLSTVKVDVPSSSVFKREQVVDVSPTVISPRAAPSGGAVGWVSFFSKDRFKAWFPGRRRDFRTSEVFTAATSAFPSMEKLESMNDPAGLLPKTQEEDNAAAIKIIKLRLKYSQVCIEAVKKMPSPNFNKEQCGYLVNKLEVVVQVARSFFKVSRSNLYCPDSSWNVTKWVGIFKLLLALGKQIEDFIAECSKSAWVEAAMTLADVAEYVSSLGFNLELCKVLFMEGECAAMQRGLTSVEVDNRFKAEAEMVQLMAIVDKEYLLKLVTLASDASDLAKYLLGRLVSVHLNPTCDEGNIRSKFLGLGVSVRRAEALGKGASATVYKATLFGFPVAQKTFLGVGNEHVLKEVGILSQWCHPNIISMFASTMTKRGCSIIVELMDCDLRALIQRRCGEQSDCPPFSLSESLDLMLQIAQGVNYLHTKRVVHRGLKSNSILVKMVRADELETGYLQAKVDFGLMTKELIATLSHPTYDAGTFRWMAPELMVLSMNNSECLARSGGVLNYKFKRDVYSFAMVCYEILTGEVPFKDKWDPREMKQLVLKGERPELPADCPALLKALIEKCWIGNPGERPTFGTICSTLKYMKYLFMRGDITPEG